MHGKPQHFNKTLTFSVASIPFNANTSLFPLLSEKKKKQNSFIYSEANGRAERSNKT